MKVNVKVSKKLVSAGLALSLVLGAGSSLTTLGVSNAPFAPQQAEASTASTQAEQEFVSLLNDLRRNMGLQEVTIDPILTKAAQNHADYLQTNGKITGQGHNEDKGKKGFTGEFVLDRVMHAGYTEIPYDLNVEESVSTITGKVKDHFNFLRDIPIHRLDLTSPSKKFVGVGFTRGKDGEKGTLVINSFESRDLIKLDTTYPYSNQKDVGVVFYGKTENPNPLAKFNVEKVGMPITFIPDSEEEWVDDFAVTLKDSKGNNVPFLQDGLGMVFIYPKSELKYSEKYTVTIKYLNKVKTWSFTTVAKDKYNVVGGIPYYLGDNSDTGTKPDNSNNTGYLDFDPNQYWSQDMLWAMESELINGYKNIYNAKYGKIGDYLKPYDTLTEAQTVTMLYRYFKPELLKSTAPESNWYASVPYQLAKQDKLNLLGSTANRTTAEKGIRRGKLAELLASLHHGKNISERDAVDFLYKAGVSNGNLDKSGMAPKTYESFGANDILQRAQIVAFLKRYNDYTKK